MVCTGGKFRMIRLHIPLSIEGKKKGNEFSGTDPSLASKWEKNEMANIEKAITKYQLTI